MIARISLTSWSGQFSLLVGVFMASVLAPHIFFDIALIPYYYACVFSLFVSATICLIYQNLIAMYYVMFSFFSTLTYMLQSVSGVDYIMGLSMTSDLTGNAAAIFILHITTLTIAAIMTGSSQGHARETRAIPTSNAIITLCVIVVLIPILISLVGIEKYIISRYELFLQGDEVNSTAKILELISKCILYIFLFFLLIKKNYSRSIIRKATVIFCLIAAISISNPVNTGRFISLSGLVLPILALMIRYNQTHRLFGFLAVAPFLMIALLPVTSLMRHGLAQITTSDAILAFEGLEFSSFQMYLDSIAYFSDKPLFSNYTLSSIGIPIPRTIWAGKAEGMGVEVATASGYYYTNAATLSFVSFYADFGYIGVVIGSAVMGWVFSKLNFAHLSVIDFWNRRTAYGIIIFCLIPIITRGDMSTAMIAIYAFGTSYEIVRALTRLTLRRTDIAGPRNDLRDLPRYATAHRRAQEIPRARSD